MKIIKLSIVALLFSTVVFSQNKISDVDRSNHKKIEKRVGHLSEDLNLSQDQKDRIIYIQKNSLLEKQKLKENANLNNENRALAMKSLRVKEREEISKVLTPEQARKMQTRNEKRSFKKDVKNRKMNKNKIQKKKRMPKKVREEKLQERKNYKVNNLKHEAESVK